MCSSRSPTSSSPSFSAAFSAFSSVSVSGEVQLRRLRVARRERRFPGADRGWRIRSAPRRPILNRRRRRRARTPRCRLGSVYDSDQGRCAWRWGSQDRRARLRSRTTSGWSRTPRPAPRKAHLKKAVGALDLTALGIGAVIGTGIFVVIGEGIGEAGPGVILSFVLAGVTCFFSALCYAELASSIPVSGSAYTYAYATLGELVAWIIGWDLILEYGVSVAAVAVGWGGNLNEFLEIAFGYRAAGRRSRPRREDGGILNLPAVVDRDRDDVPALARRARDARGPTRHGRRQARDPRVLHRRRLHARSTATT